MALSAQKNADAVQAAEHRTDDHYNKEIHDQGLRYNCFRQLIKGVHMQSQSTTSNFITG
jgi:hypothetical protein